MEYGLGYNVIVYNLPAWIYVLILLLMEYGLGLTLLLIQKY